jgi:glycosyltransferase involved in cell wall biosynthesis
MLNTIPRSLLRITAICALACVYGATLALCRLLRRQGRAPAPRSGCILVIGTFHNPNWFHAHVRPLVRSGVGEVILVCDEPVQNAEGGVRFECPPRRLAAVATRAGAKFLWALRATLRYRPDLYMGYHILPAGVMALVLGRLFGRPASYQATSGAAQLEGGGWSVENRLLAALQRPSALVERLAHGVVREFDSVVVRGSGTEAYIRRIGYQGSLAVITGSVDIPGPWRDFQERSIDLAFVGRLAGIKRPDRFVAVAAALAKTLPRMRAVMVGDGPEAPRLAALVREAGIESSVELLGQRSDVNDILTRSRVFMLTSRSEGVSIAMLEAMAAGAVPVVAEVGDLGDFIDHGENGFLVAQDDVAGYASAALALLSSEQAWRRFARQALASSAETTGVDAIARRWNQHLRAVMAKPSAEAASPSSAV